MSRQQAVPYRPWYVYVTIAIAAVGGLLFGYDAGIAGGAVIQLAAGDPSVTAWTQGLIVSIMCVGAAAGALFAGPLSDRAGRRPVIVAAGALFTVGALMSAIDLGIGWLCVARVVLGLGVGAVSMLVPVYIAELAPARIRGMLVSAFQLLITIGILVSYFVNTATAPSNSWQLALGLAAVPGAILVVGALLLPESPRFLVSSGAREAARDVLTSIRGTGADAELAEIESVVDAEGQDDARLRELASPAVRPAVLIGAFMALFAQICGINAIIYFSPEILRGAGFSEGQTNWWGAVGLGIVNVVFTIVGMLLVDRLGRKPLLVIGATGMTIALAVVALTIGTGGNPTLTFIALAFYVLFYAVGPGMLAFVIISEIFPLRFRGVGAGLALLVNWVAQIIVTYTFLPMLDSLGTVRTFWTYAVVCAAFVAFALFAVPETKGRTLEEIEMQRLGDRAPA
jgi:MFS transporter, SP family, major inositol transporter